MPLNRNAFRLEWRLPAPQPEANGSAALRIAEVAVSLPPVVSAPPWLAEAAWIEVTGATKPKEELLVLLSLGAEVEHALLVQYLYALASLDPNGSPGTRQIRDIVKQIALQEMAHFVSVQNLLLAVGGLDYLHIGRDSLRAASAQNPLPFALEPVSELTLSEYVLVESPGDIPDQSLADRISKMKELVKQKAGIEPHQVGAFYTQVYWILQPGDEPHGPLPLTPDPAHGRKPGWHLKASDFTPAQVIASYQAQPLEWKVNSGPDLLILPVGDANTPPEKMADLALSNLFSIMAQGEGVAPSQNSHFEKFLAALDLQLAGGVNVLPLPRTPYVQAPPPDSLAPTRLRKDYTVLWGKLFDIRYTMLPLDIGLALSMSVTNPDRATLKGWAFVSMRPLLRLLITQMCSPALTNLEPCGPTFGLLEEDLPAGPRAPWERYLKLLQEEAAVIAALERRPELTGDTSGSDLLSDIKTNSAQRLQFVQHKLAS
jgi:hypothetical protein